MNCSIECTSANSTFAIGGLSSSENSFGIVESLHLRMSINAVELAHRKSAQR